MSEAKFTKGDWRVCERSDHGFNVAFDKEGQLIAEYIYTEADAHLFSVSRQMYYFIDQLLSSHNNEVSGGFLNPKEKSTAQKLLAKARGE